MTPKEIAALNRLMRRLQHLQEEVMDCRAEMKEFGLDFGMQPIDPANFPIEIELIMENIGQQLEREHVKEMTDLPF